MICGVDIGRSERNNCCSRRKILACLSDKETKMSFVKELQRPRSKTGKRDFSSQY